MEVDRVFGGGAGAVWRCCLAGRGRRWWGCWLGLVFMAVRDHTNRNWLGWAAIAVVLLGGFYFSPLGEKLRARVFWSRKMRWAGRG